MMAHPSKAKGDRGELEAAHLLTELLGFRVRRKLGAGRMDDTGDLDGVHDWTLEVKRTQSVAIGVRDGLADVVREQANAATTFGAAMIRADGGQWFIAMTPEQFATVVRETVPDVGTVAS